VNTASDPANCGACSVTCPPRANATPVCAASACSFVCGAGFADCNLAATDGCESTLATDINNCGGCGRRCAPANATGSCAASTCNVAACATGFANCNGSATDGCEVNTQTDSDNCGACGTVCPAGSTCAAGRCGFGSGDSPLNVAGTVTINVIRASVAGTAGSPVLTLSNVVGTFVAGQEVILHQTQCNAGAGTYEYGRVAVVSGTTVVLEAALGSTFRTDATCRAQVVVVEERSTVSVPGSTTLTAPAWDGNSGGILALDATGDVNVAGSVTMDSRGFRGRGHGCIYRCARGYQGEGFAGLGGVNIAANSSGGGGGGAGQDDASGGGGGHAAAGQNGGTGTCGICSEACPIPGGIQGTVSGTANLRTAALFGGAGGEGGADEDGGNPGAGGSGGGLILIRASTLTVAPTGLVSARGALGANGASSACGGVGCGMGGGGGGAGGAVRLQTSGAAVINSNRISVAGGGGGTATCGSAAGGSGSVGRIGVRASAVTGTTSPAFDTN